MLLAKLHNTKKYNILIKLGSECWYVIKDYQLIEVLMILNLDKYITMRLCQKRELL